MPKKHDNMERWIETARTLSEALPFIRRYDNAIVVIKLGGHAMSDQTAMELFARDIVLMKQTNIHPIIVHGGGPMINALLSKLDVKTRFIDGRRVTTPETMEVVEMVLSGKVNKEIVSALSRQGGKAIGISGKDSDLILCTPRDPNLGLVGEPQKINTKVLEELIHAGFIPVIAPIGTDEAGETYNINGDTAAGAIAGAIKADRLLLLTDVTGIKNKDGNLLTQLSPNETQDLIQDGTIAGGMIPKSQTAMRAIEEGVRAVVILDGRVPHAVLLELFTLGGAGSLIRAM